MIVKGVALILGVFTVHTVIGYTAPYPFYQLNVIILFLLSFLIRNRKKEALWFGLVLGYCTELFSADYFGVRLVALLLSVVIVNWLLEKVFTTQAWYIITVLGFLASVIHRLLFIGLSSATQGFTNLALYTTWPVALGIVVEATINTAGLLLIYSVMSLVWVRANPRYI